MGDGRTPGRVPRGFRINVDELVIERRIGERIDAILIDDKPVRHAKFLPDIRPVCGRPVRSA